MTFISKTGTNRINTVDKLSSKRVVQSWSCLNPLAKPLAALQPRHKFQALCHQLRETLRLEHDNALCGIPRVQVNEKAKKQ